MSHKPISLASKSPRRRELLTQILGDQFSIIDSSYEEEKDLDMEPIDLGCYLAEQKAHAAMGNVSTGIIIIAADTFIIHDGQFLGKPYTRDQAKSTLRRLSGETVRAVTAFAVVDVDEHHTIVDYATTDVTLGELSEETIERYVATGEPLDRAGAFAIQEKGVVLVEKIHGCYFNVVGLPLYKLASVLEKMGVRV